MFLPYADFEEVFRNAQAASDGQYKVQLVSRDNGLELYVARQGRFNVEGYVGFEPIARSLNTELLQKAHSLTHPQVQTLLAGIGNLKNYGVYVPERDAGGLDWTLTEQFDLRRSVPSGFEQVQGILSEIDVIWTARGGEAIEGLFEVEHSTTVYSGLLRFNDVLLTDPKVSRFSIVSNEARRALFSRQLFRPTFRKSGFPSLRAFLSIPMFLTGTGAWPREMTGNRAEATASVFTVSGVPRTHCSPVCSLWNPRNILARRVLLNDEDFENALATSHGLPKSEVRLNLLNITDSIGQVPIKFAGGHNAHSGRNDPGLQEQRQFIH